MDNDLLKTINEISKKHRIVKKRIPKKLPTTISEKKKDEEIGKAAEIRFLRFQFKKIRDKIDKILHSSKNARG